MMEMEYFVPPPDGPRWLQYWCDERLAWYLRYGIDAEQAAPAATRQGGALALLLGRRPTSSSSSRGAGASSRASPTGPTSTCAPTRSTRAPPSSTSTRRPVSATSRTSIEPAAGATRTMMAFLLAAYDEDEIGGERRAVLRLHPRIAPYQVAVLPLSKKETLAPLAKDVLAPATAGSHVRLRRHAVDRAPLPAPGRDRHAVLRDGRLREPRGSRR